MSTRKRALPDLIYRNGEYHPPHLEKLRTVDATVRDFFNAMQAECSRSLHQAWDVLDQYGARHTIWVYIGLDYADASELLSAICRGVAKSVEEGVMELGDPDTLLFQEDDAPTSNTGLNAEDAEQKAGEGGGVPFRDHVLKLRKDKYPDAF